MQTIRKEIEPVAKPTLQALPGRRESETTQSRRQLFTRLLPLASAALGLPAIGTVVLLTAIHPIAYGFQSAGLWGAVGFYALFSILCGTALIPTWVAAVIAGWAFGPVVGVSVALLASLTAATLAFSLSRRVAGTSVSTLLDEQPKLRGLYQTLLRRDWRVTFLLVTLLRLPPNTGFAFMSVLLAAARAPFIPFIAGTAAGLLPRTIAICYVSAQTATLDLSRSGSLMPLVIGLGILLALIVSLSVISKLGIEKLSR
jgi:uncharacterized membrane protein YdjX (TVP38/TMEM64 family)